MAAEALPWERIKHLTRRPPTDRTPAQIAAGDQAMAHYGARFATLGAPLTDPQNVYVALATIEVCRIMFATLHAARLADHRSTEAILEWLTRLQMLVAEHAPDEVRA